MMAIWQEKKREEKKAEKPIEKIKGLEKTLKEAQAAGVSYGKYMAMKNGYLS